MGGVEFGFLRMRAGERVHFEQVARSWFFLVRKGAMWVRIEDQAPILVTAGSCIGIDGRKAFVFEEISRIPGGSRTFSGLDPRVRETPDPLEILVGCAPLSANVLLGSFWAVVHVAHDEVDPTSRWIARLGELIVMELAEDSEHLDQSAVLQRLAELIVVVLVRHMSEGPELLRRSLPTALHDARIWRALAAFHRLPAEHWTVERLAKVAGMSRTALAVRFHELVGVPPLQCLTTLRMDMAAEMLEREDCPVKTIAERVGYGSEAAFNRAFVRHCGESPGRWRARRAPDVTGPSVPRPAT